MMRLLGAGLAAWLVFAGGPALAAGEEVVVYKSPTCGCCTGWAEYMTERGYKVRTIDTDDMDLVKRRFGVPDRLQSCHTARLGRYIIEGHVPAEAIERLRSERPEVTGIASPGMPMGSPGMNGAKEDNWIFTFGPDGSRPFGKY